MKLFFTLLNYVDVVFDSNMLLCRPISYNSMTFNQKWIGSTEFLHKFSNSSQVLVSTCRPTCTWYSWIWSASSLNGTTIKKMLVKKKIIIIILNMGTSISQARLFCTFLDLVSSFASTCMYMYTCTLEFTLACSLETNASLKFKLVPFMWQWTIMSKTNGSPYELQYDTLFNTFSSPYRFSPTTCTSNNSSLSSSPDFEGLYNELSDWLNDMHLAVSDSADMRVSEHHKQHMCKVCANCSLWFLF